MAIKSPSLFCFSAESLEATGLSIKAQRIHPDKQLFWAWRRKSNTGFSLNHRLKTDSEISQAPFTQENRLKSPSKSSQPSSDRKKTGVEGLQQSSDPRSVLGEVRGTLCTRLKLLEPRGKTGSSKVQSHFFVAPLLSTFQQRHGRFFSFFHQKSPTLSLPGVIISK